MGERGEEWKGGAGAGEERPYKSSASWQGLPPTAAWAPDMGLMQDRRQKGEAENG